MAAESQPANDLTLNQPLRHDIRDHLNDIFIACQAIQAMHEDPDPIDLVKGQMVSINLIQKLLDLTMVKPELAEVAATATQEA